MYCGHFAGNLFRFDMRHICVFMAFLPRMIQTLCLCWIYLQPRSHFLTPSLLSLLHINFYSLHIKFDFPRSILCILWLLWRMNTFSKGKDFTKLWLMTRYQFWPEIFAFETLISNSLSIIILGSYNKVVFSIFLIAGQVLTRCFNHTTSQRLWSISVSADCFHYGYGTFQ